MSSGTVEPQSDIQNYMDFYKSMGWILHPLSSHDTIDKETNEIDKTAGKKPHFKNWHLFKKSVPKIQEHIESGKNLGLVCGQVSNVTVLDFDSEILYNYLFPNGSNTLESRRTIGRRHVFFKNTDELKTNQNKILSLDIRNKGGNIVLPPSVHKSGDIYNFIDMEVPIRDMTDEEIQRINDLIKLSKKLQKNVNKCGLCFEILFNKIIEDHIEPPLETNILLFSEMKISGISYQELHLLARLIFKERYTEKETNDNLKSFSEHPLCDNLRNEFTQYGIFDCKNCTRNGFKKVESGNDTYTFELDDIKIEFSYDIENNKYLTEIFHKNKNVGSINTITKVNEFSTQKKIKIMIKPYFKGTKAVNDFMIELLSDFNDWQPPENKVHISDEIEKLTDEVKNPMKYLTNAVHQIYIGEDRNIELGILSLVSLNPGVGHLIHRQTTGRTGGGKSALDEALKYICIPDEMRFPAKSVSPKALMYYAEHNTLKNKVVILDDVTEFDIEILKAYGSNNYEPPARMVVIDGKVRLLKSDASPLVWFSKVSPLNDEDGQVNARFFTSNIDERQEHIDKVINLITNDEDMVYVDLVAQNIIRRCINKEIDKIIINRQWTGADTPRDTKTLKAMIKAYALLNSKTTADGSDLAFAGDLWDELSIYNAQKINETERCILECIESSDAGITQKQICEISKKSQSTVSISLKNLISKGLVMKFKEDIGTGWSNLYYHHDYEFIKNEPHQDPQIKIDQDDWES